MQKSKKILFIVPPYLPFEEYKPEKPGLKLPTLTPSYGILSIIAYIQKFDNHDIKLLDTNKMLVQNNGEITKQNYQEHIIDLIESDLKNFNPEYICISALFNTCFPHLDYIIKTCKINKPQSLLIVGGGLATNLYEDLLSELPEIDMLCYGEGEIPFYKLLHGQYSPAWITKETLVQGIMPEYDFLENIDEIPIIDFSYINLAEYNNRSYLNKDIGPDKKEVSIHTSRGCPFNCCYCANGTVHGRKIRMMSTEKVLETIKEYIDKYKMNLLLIEDDHFLADKKRALYLLKEIKKFNINLEFPNGIAVYQIDDDIAKAFQDCGVKIIPLAIESGSDYVLKNIINKPLNKKIIFRAVNILKKYNILIHAFIIIGFPNEYDEHREETLKLVLDIEIDWAYIFIVVPIAGSRLYEQCKKENYLLSQNYADYTIGKCNIKAPGVEPKKIEEYAYYMNVKVNYIENSNFKNKKYDVCLPYFLNVVNHYPKNAIAQYMLYKIYKDMDEKELAKKHYDLYSQRSEFYDKIVKNLTLEGYSFE